jgi:hypothetical protein
MCLVGLHHAIQALLARADNISYVTSEQQNDIENE